MRCNHALVSGLPIPGISTPQLGAGSAGAETLREQRSLRQFENNLPNTVFSVSGESNRIPHKKETDHIAKPLWGIGRLTIHFGNYTSTEQKLLSGNGDRQTPAQTD